MQSTHSPYSNAHEDDDAYTRRADSNWRDDPERREAARTRIEEIQSAFDQAHEHLKQAVAAFDAVGALDPNEDALAARCQKALRLAAIRFAGDASMVMEAPNDTYLGNKAAFGYAMRD